MVRENHMGEYDSMYGTDKYITKWDRLSSEPSDVYADMSDDWFLQGRTRRNPELREIVDSEFLADPDLGENYPRGV